MARRIVPWLLAFGAAVAPPLAAQKTLHPGATPAPSARTQGARPAAAPTPVPTPAPGAAAKSATTVVVYKSPSCGCCGLWIDYMRHNGFTVVVHDQEDLTAIKRAAGVSEANASCHTAQVGGYVIEGHVPVESIRRLLRERPAIAGLTVPGMVAGTPGMEQGGQHQAYDVLAIGRDGHTSVYERH